MRWRTMREMTPASTTLVCIPGCCLFWQRSRTGHWAEELNASYNCQHSTTGICARLFFFFCFICFCCSAVCSMLLLPVSVTWHASQTHSYAQHAHNCLRGHICVCGCMYGGAICCSSFFVCVFKFLIFFFLLSVLFFFLLAAGRCEFFSFFNGLNFLIFSVFLLSSLIPHFFFLLLLGQPLWTFFFFSTLPSFNCFFCTLPARGAVCFPPNCSTRTPTDTLVTTALCASPAARMRRGRDERRAEGAVTCGRATRACGAEHTFLFLLFCFAARAGRHPQRHTHSHTLPPCFFFLFCFVYSMGVCCHRA
ncbi:hypothetical protein ECC02_013320 [Trypanosoma cruzi]|uniref:ATPase n=1 Tax=Trypanosoma cruzi TaxID=5693 RepID=A0A7J6XIP7_TRYCR|nr:hypothetical protein ECC02_013320 [Trypanosoma cruzi]